ncbi:MAG: glucose 1-dehydrogenase [Bacteroidota bacterium]
MEFNNKVVFITGAASGIGRAAAIAFAEQGATVVGADVNETRGKVTIDAIISNNGKGEFLKVDVSNFDEVEKAVKHTLDKYGQLDIGINNAGIGGDRAMTADLSVESWDKVMAINTNGVFYGMKTQLAIMQAQQSGVIINTASIAGLKAMPHHIAYTASKHAVVGMTKSAAMEYAKHNIRVNALCPVFTVTAMFNPEVMDRFKAGFSDKLKSNIPMRRFADVQEQVDAMLWLASDKASFVTGLALPIDGGLMA